MRQLAVTGKAYEGKSLIKSKDGLLPYYPEKGLIQAVEIARFLMRPLLLRGEPGCGKTRLAEALAYEMYGIEYKDYLFKWPIKSSSKVIDGIYSFDHLQRLQDVQDPEKENKPSKEEYVKPGPLGKAFKQSSRENPSILLIDEIDKADIDFPNDLLNELEWEEGKIIPIPEADDKIEIKYPPIVIITSNDERELPAAFLRRCVFYYIEFPEKEKLDEIAIAYINSFDGNKLEDKYIKELVDKFLDLRNDMDRKTVVDKKPSTSELLDWIFTHAYYKLKGTKSEDGILSYVPVLLKTENDLRAQLGEKK